VKELSLEEISLLEEMKSNCLKKGQYIDDKAKDKFYMLCHLEDFSIAYYELLDVIKEVREYIETEGIDYEFFNMGNGTKKTILKMLDKVGETDDSKRDV
jgi:hypothetical protein